MLYVTSASLFHPVMVRIFRISYSGSSPFHPSVQKHARQVNWRSCYLLFYTPAPLQTGNCSCVAGVDGWLACVFVGFTFCDRLLLSQANTKPTPKPCHLAWIQLWLSEPCKCQQDACHSSAWLPWQQDTWQLPHTMGCCGATEMIRRCRWQTGGRPRGKISPLRCEQRQEMGDWWRIWGRAVG